ncbi:MULTISPECIES: AbrB/MazE/SpoVT family DNA-binding domain-containing protein [unclassified Neisseria]|uniref:AbrB/MazE/SpoVT family DNA-binding domain-containing protein n=1 Tax=unclassified Neisseria TaxID=2623750 RepID=UPI001D168531|nr:MULTISPECIES: AbrB/MazE/SpoVT family DNA-binding domain-containing protein [unclassified Neisseria]
MATTLRLNSKSQVTFKQEFLHHLGISAGDEMEVYKLPNGELRIRAKAKLAQTKSIREFAGRLKNEAGVHLSVEEINQAVAEAAVAGAGMERKLVIDTNVHLGAVARFRLVRA